MFFKLHPCFIRLTRSAGGCRNKSGIGLWDGDLTTEVKLQIEKHWSAEAMQHNKKKMAKTCYVLPMFPYPSGNLHMGHVRVYSISDTIARLQRFNGYKVVHPMGWDAFGLPAENAALERNIAPDQWTLSNITTMKKQLQELGFNFDWDLEISTCDPKYYKWTQYIFIKLYEEGLAYQSKALVNWDPVDKTVLADEQVDDKGCSWRSGAIVEKKILTQWFIRTTKFAKLLYDGLSSKNLQNWKDIINLQKHWIGECNGIVVTFKINANDSDKFIDVWTSEPYKFLHGTFLVMSRSNVLIQDINEKQLDNLKAYNPLTDSEIPIYITDNENVDYPEGRDIYIASPATNERDRQLALILNITENLDVSTSIDINKDNERAIELAKIKKLGGHNVSSKLKDWLISRQRYWGTPIPIIHCKKCGHIPVPYDDLPVILPDKHNMQNWINCKCPKCQSGALRETDTMDTFVDSSWYYYRFLDPNNTKMPFDKQKLDGYAPVDIYIGGKEHAVLHLYYARFMSYFLYSLGWTPTQEPFKKLLVQGVVMGESCKLKSSGKYISRDKIVKIDGKFIEKDSGEPVIIQWEKMSKSKYNGENPENLLKKYGCDTTRLLMLADVPPATSRHWSEDTFPGVLNWQNRLWMTIRTFLKTRNDLSVVKKISNDEFNAYNNKIWDSRNYFIATATYHFRYTQKLSVGISRLQALTNTLRNKVPPEVIAESEQFEKALGTLIIMLAPAAPHFCSELWAGFVSAPKRICPAPLFLWDEDVHQQSWPRVDDDYPLSFLCKVDGADRCELKIKSCDLSNLNEDDALHLMIKQQTVANRLKKGIARINYELYPGCRAILNIYTNRNSEKLKETIAN